MCSSISKGDDKFITTDYLQQCLEISPDGLFVNLIAFNIGVEIGQLLALSAILIVMSYWRQTASFFRHAYTANVVMMSAGFLLMSYQLCGYILA
jgi:hypothetical protein